MAEVQVEVNGEIAHIIINNPPVNALNQSVRAGLLAAVEKINADDAVKLAIVRGHGRAFIAGADITELGKVPLEPQLPNVIAAIEGARVPIVAAIHGLALGGGLEVAMACHARIAESGAKLGLPEVSLGIIPGSGGTVRLPRLVPIEEAIKLVTGGKPIGARSALAIGLVDQISDGELVGAAETLGRSLLDAPLVSTLSRAPRVDGDVDWSSERSRLEKRSRGAVAPLEALDALQEGIILPADEALAKERERFLRLAKSEQSEALRHVFFAERGAGKSLRNLDVAPADLNPTGVIGGGTMGAGIAVSLLLAGGEVRLVEQNDEAAARAHGRVADMLSESARRGVISEEKQQRALASLKVAANFDVLVDCPLVIEAVFEDMNIKREVFARLDKIMPAEAILATNTSYLDINTLAASTMTPERVLGLHFFSPAHVMKLLEVVRGDKTGQRALATGAALARKLKKTAVVAGVCDGFIGNRIMATYRRDCEFMLEEGALPEQIDAAMRDFGFAMGIYEVQDMSGLDIAWAQRKARAASRSPSERYAHIADRLCELGRFGRKAGKGWYDYGSGKAVPDPEVTNIISEERKKAGIEPRAFTSDEIMRRILSVMQTEGNRILEEGIADDADDIDVVMILGYGFPRHLGGPMFMAGRGDGGK